MLNTLFPLALFALVSSITPGPNNIMLTASGILFGFLRTIPHMLGITFGFGVLLAVCAAGVGQLVLAAPMLHLALKLVGSAYLVYLAWQLRSTAFTQRDAQGRPMSLLSAALFQFANPKAWVMAVTGASAFLPVMQSLWCAVAVFCLVFCVINLPCIGVWAGSGAVLRRYLAQPRGQRLFCAVMVLLTLYSAAAIWV